jgi:hypothetical protein
MRLLKYLKKKMWEIFSDIKTWLEEAQHEGQKESIKPILYR